MSEINQLIPQDQLETMSRRDRKKHETRWRIFTAAKKLMAKYGYDAVTIEHICREADVSNPAFFHHFSNKAALVRAQLDNLCLSVEAGLADKQDSSSLEKLRVVNKEVHATGLEASAFTPQLLAGLFSGGEHGLDIAHFDNGITGIVAEIIQQGQSKGELNRQYNARVIALSLVSTWLTLPLILDSEGIPQNPHDELLNFTMVGLSKSA